MLPSLNQVIPLLRWDLKFITSDNVPIVESGENEYRFAGISADDFFRIIKLINGIRSVEDICKGVSCSAAAALVRKLMELNLAIDSSIAVAPLMCGNDFAKHCRALFSGMRSRLFGHELWRSLTSGEATEAQFAGWIIESYHFIQGVNDRLPLAIAECSEVNARRFFARHLIEEYDHSKFFVASLEALGIDRQSLLDSKPIPGTLAVLNFMRQCAREDSLHYAVCSGLLESTGIDRRTAGAFYDSISAHYALNRPEVISPMRAHVRLDESYGHGSILESVCTYLEPISIRRASRAVSAGYLFLETLELWCTDVLRSYSGRSIGLRTTFQGYR